MLYSQVHSVIDNLHESDIIAKMGRLAARLEQIQKLEQIDRAREAIELQEMESILMKIPDDRPTSYLPH